MDELELALQRLSAKFRDRCAREGAEIQSIVAARRLDDPRLRQLVHGLAGAGGTFGFPEVSVLASQVEKLIGAGEPGPPGLSALLACLAAVAADRVPSTVASA